MTQLKKRVTSPNLWKCSKLFLITLIPSCRVTDKLTLASKTTGTDMVEEAFLMISRLAHIVVK